MHVILGILDSADLDSVHAVVLCNPGHVGPQLWLHVLLDRPKAVFCAENHVDMIADVGASHRFAVPPGLDKFTFGAGDSRPRLQIVTSLPTPISATPALLGDPGFATVRWRLEVANEPGVTLRLKPRHRITPFPPHFSLIASLPKSSDNGLPSCANVFFSASPFSRRRSPCSPKRESPTRKLSRSVLLL